jgi:hypothetical protein
MGQSRKLAPGCRIRAPLDPHVLEDALKRGAAEPDLALPMGDGTGSSKHSLNPRLSAGSFPAIFNAYGEQVRDATGNPLTIIQGKAVGAIEQEKVTIAADLVVIGANCQADPTERQEQYNRLWLDLGRLSHYVADLHSPFHANSFGVAELQDDYHEASSLHQAGSGGCGTRGRSVS